MVAPYRLAAIAAALALAVPAQAATSQDKLLAELKRLAERVDKLEKRNAELEAQVAAPAPADLGRRVAELEEANRQLAASMESDRISENEPEIATRLKALEAKTDSHSPAAKLAEALDGIKVEGSVAGVVQGVNGKGRSDGKDETVTSWRGDVNIALPGGNIGAGKGEFFAHLRMGQGSGLTNLHPTFTGATNSLAFQQDGVPSENTNAIVAQAWYQLTTPLGDAPHSPHSLQLTVGKIDPFVFFDQNAIADNEAQKFLNNVFVHNPMLDSGGGTGADGYGFAPGVRLAYRNESGKPEWWQASIGVFGAGEGATFGRSFTKPFVIGQLETGQRLFGGLNGTYRAYAWHNGQYEGYDGSVDSTSGWGLSVDQLVDEDVTLFARYGHVSSGKAAFDRALTLGAEVDGSPWGRGADSVGLAWAWLRSSDGFKAAAPTLPDFGYGARGAEQVGELYYRYHVNNHLALSPDLQVIRKPGADPNADTITAVGLRALYAF